MTTLSGAAVAALARNAGLTGAGLVTAVAVAKGESGWRTDARGDVALVDAKWGPSIGLWQIRSLNAEPLKSRKPPSVWEQRSKSSTFTTVNCSRLSKTGS